MSHQESGRDIGVWLHGYQPPRWVHLHPFNSISTDPNGIDHTERIYYEVYKVFAELGLFDLISFDAYYSVRHELAVIESRNGVVNGNGVSVIEAMKKADGGIGDSGLHAILPDLSAVDKRVLIGAGKQLFTTFYGHEPEFFWPPESALDTDTLIALDEVGYKGVVVAPWQLYREDAHPIDGTPIRVALPNGRSIMAIPFDEGLSMALAFKPKHDAFKFVYEHFASANAHFNRIGVKPQFAFTDLETFGEHWKLGQYFLATLLKEAMPSMGINLAKISDVDLTRAVPGKVWDRSAWSCKHGDLQRWRSGNCGCHGGDTSWIDPYYRAFENLLDGVRDNVADNFGMSDRPDEFVASMISRFEPAYLLAHPSHADIDISVAGAYVAALAARTSCATFFDTVGTSGWINALFAVVALEHLKNAGMTRESGKLKDQFEADLNQVVSYEVPNGMYAPLMERIETAL